MSGAWTYWLIAARHLSPLLPCINFIRHPHLGASDDPEAIGVRLIGGIDDLARWRLALLPASSCVGLLFEGTRRCLMCRVSTSTHGSPGQGGIAHELI